MSKEALLALSSSAALAELPTEALEALSKAVTPRTITAGATLFEAGAPADGMVVIDRGRLGVTNADDDVIATMGRGEILGEMGALTGDPRSSTVVALRDTAVLELDQHEFDRAFDLNPVVGRALSRLVVSRLLGDDDGPHLAAPRTVAIVTVGGGEVDDLIDALQSAVDSAAVVAADISDGRSDSELLTAMETLETDNDLVVLLPGDVEQGGGWLDRCLRQADAVLIAVTEPRRAAPDALAEVTRRLRSLRSTIELIIVNPRTAEVGIDPTAWLERVRPDRLHHVRIGDRATVERVARLVLGRGVGLVFSGGAAKGLAHMGAWRAISELDVPIDSVAGVSFGALMGAGVALDYTPEQLYSEVNDRLVSERGLVDVTFPWMALLKGREISKRIEQVGRGRSFEQTWRNFVCTSCDLTTGTTVEHRSGLLWQAIRASVSIPGVLPPIRLDDRLLVDGAVLNNLPIASLRAGHPTPMKVIAIDVGKDGFLAAGETPDDGHVSGWRLMARRVHPRRPDPGVPSMAQMLMRVMELAGDDTNAVADQVIRPDLSALGLADFEQIDGFELAGYEATIEALS